ncbi:MAG: DUF3108 domain-containing protein [Beijerinckiaceae bacterium]
MAQTDRIRRTLRQVCASGVALGLAVSPASADILKAHYTVSIVGLHVGDLYADGTMGQQNYRISLNAKLSGLAAMLSSLRLALASSGAVKKNGLAPSAYATSSANSGETRTLRMALNSGTVRAVEIMPPPDFHGLERVPVSEDDKRNILDPTSALIMTVPAEEQLVGAAACNRTLPIYDGYARFDIQLSFSGTRDVAVAGYSGPVSVCKAHYHPVSGHYVNSKSAKYMSENNGIEVWLAPVEHAHVVVPLRVSMPTQSGHVVIEAVEFQISASGGEPTTHDASAH